MARRPQTQERLNILKEVRTPLGFFVLALLVVEATFLAVGTQTGQDKSTLFLYNLGTILILTVIVAVLAYLNILDGSKGKFIRDYSIFIEPPSDLPGLDINKIIWDQPNCRMTINGKEITFVPTSPFNALGGALEIRIPGEDFPSDEHAPIQMSLADQFGNRWDVISFRLWQRNLRLRIRSDKNKIIRDYSDEGDQ